MLGMAQKRAGGAVDAGRGAHARDAVALVDVAEHVELGPALGHELLEQCLLAHALACHGLVQDAPRRTVRDQNVDVGRQLGPMLLRGEARRHVERHDAARNGWRHGRAVDLDALHEHGPVFHVDAVRQQRPRDRRIVVLAVAAELAAPVLPVGVVLGRVQAQVVVACDHNLVAMRQCAEPVVELADLAMGAVLREVAAVDQQIARWHAHVAVAVVRVRDAHDAQRSFLSRIAHERVAQSIRIA